jgi:hypothetical protein
VAIAKEEGALAALVALWCAMGERGGQGENAVGTLKSLSMPGSDTARHNEVRVMRFFLTPVCIESSLLILYVVLRNKFSHFRQKPYSAG